MKDQIDPQIVALRTLQRQDRRLTVLERKLRLIPKRLRELDGDLAKLEKMLTGERATLEETRSFQGRQQSQLQDEEDLVRNSKQKIGQVKNARELNAAQRELETTRRLITTRTEEIGKLQSAVRATEERIAKMDAMLTELRGQADAERIRLAAEKIRLETEIARARATRGQLTKGLEARLLATYERIRQRFADGFAFIAAHRERCTACKMQVPHVMYMQLMRGNEILACESCGRMLYWSGLFPEEEAQLEPKPKAAPGDEHQGGADAA